jgi:hypothetical protein
VNSRVPSARATAGFRPGDTIRVNAQHLGSRLLTTWNPAFHSGNPASALRTCRAATHGSR